MNFVLVWNLKKEIMNLPKWKKLLRSEDCGQAGKLSEELKLPTAESALLRS